MLHGPPIEYMNLLYIDDLIKRCEYIFEFGHRILGSNDRSQNANLHTFPADNAPAERQRHRVDIDKALRVTGCGRSVSRKIRISHVSDPQFSY